LGTNHYVLEPGRYLVGNTIDMETTIIETKQVANKQYIIVKNGVYSGLVDTLLYHKQFEYKLKTEEGLLKLETNQSDIANYEFLICGESSDSKNRLGKFYINEKYKTSLVTSATLVVPNAECYVSEFFMPLGGDLSKQYSFTRQLAKEIYKK